MMHAGNQKSITVNRLMLFEKLKANQIQHRKDYEEAVIGYRIKLKADLENALNFIDELPVDMLKELKVNFAFPSNFDKEYENAIVMLEWSVSENVDLDQQTFQQYVQNEWSWSRGFDLTASSYKTFAAGAMR
jgi:hypothetical protein